MFSLTGTHLHRGSPVSSLVLTGGWPLRSLAAQALSQSCPRLNDVPIGAHSVPQSVHQHNRHQHHRRKAHRLKVLSEQGPSTQGPIRARPIGTSSSPLASALSSARPLQLNPLGPTLFRSPLSAQPSSAGLAHIAQRTRCGPPVTDHLAWRSITSPSHVTPQLGRCPNPSRSLQTLLPKPCIHTLCSQRISPSVISPTLPPQPEPGTNPCPRLLQCTATPLLDLIAAGDSG